MLIKVDQRESINLLFGFQNYKFLSVASLSNGSWVHVKKLVRPRMLVFGKSKRKMRWKHRQELDLGVSWTSRRLGSLFDANKFTSYTNMLMGRLIDKKARLVVKEYVLKSAIYFNEIFFTVIRMRNYSFRIGFVGWTWFGAWAVRCENCSFTYLSCEEIYKTQPEGFVE